MKPLPHTDTNHSGLPAPHQESSQASSRNAALKRFAPLLGVLGLLFGIAFGGTALANHNQPPNIDPQGATVTFNPPTATSTRTGEVEEPRDINLSTSDSSGDSGISGTRTEPTPAPQPAPAPAPAQAPQPAPAPAPAQVPAPTPQLNYQPLINGDDDDDWDDDWDDDGDDD